jgi:hypothetical protein
MSAKTHDASPPQLNIAWSMDVGEVIKGNVLQIVEHLNVKAKSATWRL